MDGGWSMLLSAALGLFVVLIVMVIPLIMFYTFDHIQQQPYLTSNWNNGFVEDITLVNSFRDCPAGYHDVVEYTFPGTGYGCLCKDTDTVKQGRCCSWRRQKRSDDQGVEPDCPCVGKTIYPTQEQEFTFWRDEQDNQEYRICVHRLEHSTFANRAKNGKDGCRNTEKGCGNQKTKPETFFCVPKKQKCPIRKFAITGAQDAAPKGFEESVSFEAEFGKAIHFSRESIDELPLSEFTVAQGSDGVCSDNPQLKKLQEKPVEEEYPLLRVKQTDCQVDTRYVQVLKSDRFHFYIANDATYLTKQLPRFLLNKSSPISAYFKSYNDVPMNCRDTVQGLSNLGEFPQIMKNGSAFLFIMGLVYIVTLIVHKLTDEMFTLVIRIIISIVFAVVIFIMYNHFAATHTAIVSAVATPECFSEALIEYAMQVGTSKVLAFYLFLIIMTISILTIYEIIITVHHDVKHGEQTVSEVTDVYSQYSDEYPAYETEEETEKLVQKKEGVQGQQAVDSGKVEAVVQKDDGQQD